MNTHKKYFIVAGLLLLNSAFSLKSAQADGAAATTSGSWRASVRSFFLGPQLMPAQNRFYREQLQNQKRELAAQLVDSNSSSDGDASLRGINALIAVKDTEITEANKQTPLTKTERAAFFTNRFLLPAAIIAGVACADNNGVSDVLLGSFIAAQFIIGYGLSNISNRPAELRPVDALGNSIKGIAVQVGITTALLLAVISFRLC